MTLVPRPAEPEPVALCCGDHGTNDRDVQRLRDLMAGGMSQPDASRLLWGDVGAACWWLLLAPALILVVAYLGGAR